MSDTETTAAESVRAILARGTAADELGRLVRRLGLSATDIAAIADAVRHCPHAVAAAGRAMAHGGRARDVVGPDPKVSVGEHLIHAADHVEAAGPDLRAKTDLDLRHVDHAIARLMLAREATP